VVSRLKLHTGARLGLRQLRRGAVQALAPVPRRGLAAAGAGAACLTGLCGGTRNGLRTLLIYKVISESPKRSKSEGSLREPGAASGRPSHHSRTAHTTLKLAQ